MAKLAIFLTIVWLLTVDCGSSGSTAVPSPACPTQHGEVTDPIGDVLPYPGVTNPPDLVRGTADVCGGNITFSVRLASGTFDSATTLLIITLDTDLNPSTGVSMLGDGVDYVVSMPNGQGNQALIGKYAGTTLASSSTVGFVPVAFVADGMDVTVPLSLIGSSDGKMNFRVESFVHLPGMLTSPTLDWMPDFTLPSGHVR